MPRRSCVAEGWALFHDAIMRAGAEADYYPPEEPELKGRRYLLANSYRDLSAPLTEFASVDVEALGSRADLVKRAIWRWIRKSAATEIKGEFYSLLALRNRTQVLAGFSAVLARRRLSGAPAYEPANPVSVVRFGHWLIKEQSLSDTHPVVPIIWGLALIGAGWRSKGQRGYCEFCYRHAYPGGRFCPFHRQSSRSDEERSQAYVRYRKGRLAAVKDQERNGAPRSFVKSAIMDYETGHQTLATILFPMAPLDGWEQERKDLIHALEDAPRVLKMIGGKQCLSLPYEDIAERLRTYVDPYKFDDFLWWAAVWHAEKWLVLEAIPSSRKRGKGRTTQVLVERAIELARAGGTNSQIAFTLGVAPSTVSSWVQRYPEFRKACMNRVLPEKLLE